MKYRLSLLLVGTLLLILHLLIPYALSQPPEELMPPTDVDWKCEMGAPEGFLNASPIPNVAAVLWSRGGAKASGFGISLRRSSLTPMPPLICGGAIVLTDNENVYALNLDTGDVMWGTSIYWEPEDPKPWYVTHALGLELFVHSMASEGRRLYIATSPSIYDERSRIVCLDLESGRAIWISSLDVKDSGVYSNVLVYNGKVYVGTLQFTHTLYALDAANGEIVWKTALPGGGGVYGISTDGSMLYVTDSNGYFYIVNPETGEVTYQVNPGCLGLSVPVVHRGRVYMTGGTGELVVIDVTGKPKLEKVRTGCSDVLPPTIVEGGLAVLRTLGESEKLILLNPETLEEIWEYQPRDINRFVQPPISTSGSTPKIVLALETKQGTYRIEAVYLNGSMAWSWEFSENMIIASASRGKLVVAEIGPSRWDGKVTVFGEREEPAIKGIHRVPESPTSRDHVRVAAEVTDEKSAVYKVALAWSVDGQNWRLEEMKREGGVWEASIPPQPNGTTVYYRVIAVDNVGNWRSSETLSYTVYNPPKPPRVTILTPRNGSLIESAEVTISWSVEAGDLPVKTVRLIVDGGRWIEVSKLDHYTLKDLESGVHTVDAIVSDVKGVTSRSNVTFTVKAPEAKSPLTPILTLVVILALAVATYYKLFRKT